MDLVELKKIEIGSFQRHPWELTRKYILQFFTRRHLSFSDPVLDIGGGDAFVANSLALANPKRKVGVVDTNYNEDILKQLQPGLSPNCHLFKSLREAFNQPVEWKGILLMDVLEHVEQPEELLRTLAITQNRFPFVFITVPAFQQLYGPHDVALGHCRRYNKKELLQLLHYSGLKVVESGYCFNFLILLPWLQKMMGHSKQRGLYKWNAPEWFTKLVAKSFFLEFMMFRFFSKMGMRLPGLTVYAICRF